MAQLKEGKKAPNFKLKNQKGEQLQLNKLDSDYVVLYFYPRDSTPGCTIEAKEFTKELPLFSKLNAKILGVSGNDEISKQKFCAKYKLKITLLADPDFAVAKSYGAYGEKKFMGLKFKGIKRQTFVLDAKRKILKIYRDVKAKGHAQEVLDFIKSHAVA